MGRPQIFVPPPTQPDWPAEALCSPLSIRYRTCEDDILKTNQPSPLSCCGKLGMHNLLSPRQQGGVNKRCFCPSVCLSVRPSVVYIQRIIQEPKGKECPNLEGRFPTFDATHIPVSRSKGQRSRSPGPLMLTHIVRYIFRTARPTNFRLGIRMEDDDPHQPQAP